MKGNTNSMVVGSNSVTPEPSYTQLINYTMLYDEGDECTSVTGGWGLCQGTYSSVYGRKDAQSITLAFTASNAASNHDDAYTNTENEIDVTDYITMVANYTNVNITTGSETNQNKPFSVYYNTFNSSSWETNRLAYYTSTFATEVQSYDISGHTTIKPIFYVNGWKSISCYADVTINHVLLVKDDNWQEWISKVGLSTDTYTTLDSVLADSTALETLMNNEEAVKYMVYNCTGTVMAGCIQAQTAIDAIADSRYLSMIYGNVHWKKFLDMIEFTTRRTYLYKNGDECVETGSNWVTRTVYAPTTTTTTVTMEKLNGVLHQYSDVPTARSYCDSYLQHKESMIDLTDYNKLCFIVDSATSNLPTPNAFHAIAITPDFTASATNAHLTNSDSVTWIISDTLQCEVGKVVTIDISSITGNRYVGVFVRRLGSPGPIDTTFSKIWLEK